MEPQDAGAAKFICFWVLLDRKLGSDLPVDKVWIEDIELVTLNNLQQAFDRMDPAVSPELC